MPRAPLAHLLIAIVAATLFVKGLRAIDDHSESVRAAEMAQAAEQARAWLYAQPIREVER